MFFFTIQIVLRNNVEKNNGFDDNKEYSDVKTCFIHQTIFDEFHRLTIT